MNAQEAFDFSASGIIAQGGPAMANVGITEPKLLCRYRAPQLDGTMRKCAIGQFIPDDVYSPDLEDEHLFNVLEYCGKEAIDALRTEEDCDHEQLAVAMQRAHDSAGRNQRDIGADFFVQWRDDLLDVAQRFDLSPAVLYL